MAFKPTDLVSSKTLAPGFKSEELKAASIRRILEEKLSRLDGYQEGQRITPYEFDGVEFPTASARLPYISNYVPLTNQVLVNGQVWNHIPRSISGRTTFQVANMGPDDLLVFMVDGVVYTSKLPNTTSTLNGMLESVCPMSPEIGGSRSVCLKKLNDRPFNSLSTTYNENPVPVTVTTEEGVTEKIMSSREFLRNQRIENVSVWKNHRDLPDVTPEVTDFPLFIRRGVRSFRYEKRDAFDRVAEQLAVLGNVPKTLTLNTPYSIEIFRFQAGLITTTNGTPLCTISSSCNDTPYVIEVYQGGTLTEDALSFRDDFVTELNQGLVLRSGDGKVFALLDQPTPPTGERLVIAIKHLLLKYFDIESTTDDSTISIPGNIERRVSLESAYLISHIQDTSTELDVDEKTISVIAVDGPYGSGSYGWSVVGEDTIEVKPSRSPDGMIGGRFTLRMDLPLIMFGGDRASLIKSEFTIRNAEIRNVLGRSSVKFSDLLVTYGAACLYLHGKIAQNDSPGDATAHIEYQIVRTENETDRTETRSVINTFLIESDKYYNVRYDAVRNIGSKLISCDIFVPEDSYMLLTYQLVDLLTREAGNTSDALTLIAEHEAPSGEVKQLLGEKTAKLLAGWNRITVSEDLFMVPMIDRGPFGPDGDYATTISTLDTADLINGVLYSEDGAGLIEDGFSGRAWIKINSINYEVSEFLENGFKLAGYQDGKYRIDAPILIKQTTIYRRYANRFYQRNDVGEPIKNIPGPIFYLSGSGLIPASSLTNLRDINPEPGWGFIVGDLEQYRITSNLISCPPGSEIPRTADEPDTMLLPVSMPNWARWLADGNPMVRVSDSDLDWNLPKNYEEAYSHTDDYVLRFSANHVGNLEQVLIEETQTGTSWPIVVIPYSGHGSPSTPISRLDIVYFGAKDHVHPENDSEIVGIGVVSSAEVETLPTNRQVWKVTIVTQFIPQETTSAIILSGTGPNIISHFMAGGPSPRVSAGYEFTFSDDAPRKLLLDYTITDGMTKSMWPEGPIAFGRPPVSIT